MYNRDHDEVVNMPRPFDIATEIHPTHVVIAAKQSALHAGMWVSVPVV